MGISADQKALLWACAVLSLLSAFKTCACVCCRCAERLVLGPSRISVAGSGDIREANSIAQEMVFRCGFSKRLGPVSLWEESESYLGQGSHSIANIGPSLSRIALADVEEVRAKQRTVLAA